MLTVKDLIQQLSKIEDQDQVVLVASDPEGNAFRALEEVSPNNPGSKDGYYWDVFHPDDELNGDEDSVTVLWP